MRAAAGRWRPRPGPSISSPDAYVEVTSLWFSRLITKDRTLSEAGDGGPGDEIVSSRRFRKWRGIYARFQDREVLCLSSRGGGIGRRDNGQGRRLKRQIFLY